ncbi:MaoC/PaaZ C-terminal domain-containing protein [Tomitella biformata]|uniref:MaoC/PaaZ C-terminal domain-containing protein n=1 Tax=Tomitella biformata TaxID=630403 RepID=UPI000464D489|nr:MaoC/PaaZ C-terminal domain-containing protein [Tomitella biformata]
MTLTIYAEDLRKGAAHQLGSHTVTEAELVEFAAQWDPQGFHIDRSVADAGQFGGLIASGIHTLAIYQRLSVVGIFDDWAVIAGRELRSVRFLRPVRPGDALTGTVVIEDIVFDDRARALVTTSAELVDGAGDRVLSLLMDAYVHARPST